MHITHASKMVGNIGFVRMFLHKVVIEAVIALPA